MAYVGILWIIGIICIIGALLGKEISFGDFKVPASAEPKVRGALAVVGILALVAGAAIFRYPNGMQQSQQASQTTGTGQSVTAPSTDSPTPAPSSPSPMPSQVPSSSASPGHAGSPAVASVKPLYLSSLTGTTDNSLLGQVAPESGPQALGSTTYPHSLAYSISNIIGNPQSITYTFPGKYHYLVAKVGASSPRGNDDDGSSIGFEVDDGSGNQLGTTSAKYGNPGDLRVNVQGQTSLTLVTSANGTPGGADAVWGNVELLP